MVYLYPMLMSCVDVRADGFDPEGEKFGESHRMVPLKKHFSFEPVFVGFTCLYCELLAPSSGSFPGSVGRDESPALKQRKLSAWDKHRWPSEKKTLSRATDTEPGYPGFSALLKCYIFCNHPAGALDNARSFCCFPPLLSAMRKFSSNITT